MSNRPSKFDDIPGGWTGVPNYLHDTTALTGVEKLVAWSHHRRAFGTATVTDERRGATSIAATHRLDKRTVRGAIRRLVEFGVLVPEGARKRGFAQRYRLALKKPDALSNAERGRGILTPTGGGASQHLPRGAFQHRPLGHPNTDNKTKQTAFASKDQVTQDVTSAIDTDAGPEDSIDKRSPFVVGENEGSEARDGQEPLAWLESRSEHGWPLDLGGDDKANADTRTSAEQKAR